MVGLLWDWQVYCHVWLVSQVAIACLHCHRSMASRVMRNCWLVSVSALLYSARFLPIFSAMPRKKKNQLDLILGEFGFGLLCPQPAIGRGHYTMMAGVCLLCEFHCCDWLCTHIRRASKKGVAHILKHNFGKCWPILKILSLLDSARNLQQNYCYISHRSLSMSLHYLAKYKRSKIAKIWHI